MAEVIRFTISGLAELKAALRELPDSAAKSVVRRVLKKSAGEVVTRAREQAPKRKGTLKQSITVSTKLSRRQRRQHKKQHTDDVEMFIGAGPHKQATLQEFGTRNRQSQSFLRPAWDSAGGRVLANIRDDMAHEIDKTAKRLAKRAARKAKKKG